MHRTRFLAGALSGCALAPFARLGAAAAEDYPSRPVTLVVPWGAGGGSDQMARALSKVLETSLKTASVPVINVPGADGNDGMVKLVSSDADGYTLAVFVADTFYGNLTSKTAPPWQLKDIVPLAVMNQQPFAYFVAQNSPYKTWADVMNAAKTTPVKVAIDGFGSVEDLVTKFFASKGLKFVGIPFPKPGERYAAILGSQVDVMCDPNGNVRRYVEAGQVRPVLVFSEKRVAEIPATPTASELGYKVAVSEWRSIVAKAGTPPATVQFLAETLAQAYKTAAFQDFLKSTWSVSDSFVSYKDMPGFLKAREQEIKSLQAATR